MPDRRLRDTDVAAVTTRLSGDDWGYLLLGFVLFPLVIGLLVFAEMSL